MSERRQAAVATSPTARPSCARRSRSARRTTAPTCARRRDIGLYDDGIAAADRPRRRSDVGIEASTPGVGESTNTPWRLASMPRRPRASSRSPMSADSAAAWHHRRRHGPDRRSRARRGLIHDSTDLRVPPVAARRALDRCLRRVRSDRRFAARRAPAGPARAAPLPDGRPPPVPARRRRHRHDRRPGRQVGGAQPAQPRGARPQRLADQAPAAADPRLRTRPVPGDARRQRRLDRRHQHARLPPRRRQAHHRQPDDGARSRSRPDSPATPASRTPSSATCCCRPTTSATCTSTTTSSSRWAASDQWGNITAGIDLIRKTTGAPPTG